MVGTAPISSTRKEVFNENDVNSIRQGIQARTGVFSGCEVSTDTGLALNIASGAVYVSGVYYVVGATTKTMVPNTTLDMQALIYYDTAAGVSVSYGTPGVKDTNTNYFERYTPSPPTLSAGVILAQVYLPAAETTLTNNMIIDKRILIKTSITIPHNGVFNFYASDGSTLVAQITDDGNLYLLGRVVSL